MGEGIVWVFYSAAEIEVKIHREESLIHKL